jgi:hypothetical protein
MDVFVVPAERRAPQREGAWSVKFQDGTRNLSVGKIVAIGGANGE